MNLKELLLTLSILAIAALPSAAEENFTGSIFAGYNNSSGNTDKASATLDATAGKKLNNGESELLGKARIFYGESNNRMDTQKWDVLAKYIDNFGEDLRWFVNYQLGADHDKYAGVDYRILPAVGLGYHFAREEAWTWNADVSLGYEMITYNTGAADEDNVVVIGHTFAKKQVFEKAFISEDLSIIPGLESGAGVRVKSETAFTNPLSDVLDLEIKYIIDYDSEPTPGKTSTDRQIVAGIKYKF